MIATILVTPKPAAKRELLFNKLRLIVEQMLVRSSCLARALGVTNLQI
jgi:hypothetical protein